MTSAADARSAAVRWSEGLGDKPLEIELSGDVKASKVSHACDCKKYGKRQEALCANRWNFDNTRQRAAKRELKQSLPKVVRNPNMRAIESCAIKASTYKLRCTYLVMRHSIQCIKIAIVAEEPKYSSTMIKAKSICAIRLSRRLEGLKQRAIAAHSIDVAIEVVSDVEVGAIESEPFAPAKGSWRNTRREFCAGVRINLRHHSEMKVRDPDRSAIPSQV